MEINNEPKIHTPYENRDSSEVIEIAAEDIEKAQKEGKLLIAVKASSGPLPAPEILAGYDRVLPGTAERIIAVFESNVKHQQDMDTKQLTAAVSYADKGQNRGFILSLAGLASGLTMAVLGFISGHSGATITGLVAGSALSGASVFRLVSKFIDGPNETEEDVE